MITVTPGILERLERRTAHRLAGLEEPDETTRKYSPDGSTVVREPEPLPSGQKLLAQFLEEGRSLEDRALQVAKEAAVVELLVSRETLQEEAAEASAKR